MVLLVEAIDDAGKLGHGGAAVEELDHRALVRLDAIAAAEPHRPHPADGVGKVFRRNLERQKPPIEPVMEEGLLDHVLGRIPGHGVTDERQDRLNRRSIHGGQ
jgi:hypothetical protein